MTPNLRVVAPFRPMPAEYDHHKALTDFDWIDAIRMMRASVASAGLGDALVLTDVDTDLPFPLLRYTTRHRRLMLWYLEIAVCYLASNDFDRDTIMLDSDQLVFGNLARWFAPLMDLGILARRPDLRDPNGFTILNGVQFWPLAGKAKLVGFYERALDLAERLPEDAIAWGADTIALQRLLAPVDPASSLIVDRDGLRVRLIDADDVLERLSSVQIRQLRAGRRIARHRDVLDFRNTRKVYMRDVFDVTLGAGVAS